MPWWSASIVPEHADELVHCLHDLPEPLKKGRQRVEAEIFKAAEKKVRVFGVELLDIRFNVSTHPDDAVLRGHHRRQFHARSFHGQ